MLDFDEWLIKQKEKTPELSDFIEKAKPYFLKTGFDIQEFEKAVNRGLKKIEIDVAKSYDQSGDVKN